VSDPRYAANPTNRCYFCKSELYSRCTEWAAQLGLAAIVDGFNADDLRDHRPGHQAAREHAIRSPLAEVGLTKDEIRASLARARAAHLGQAQMPCLASRIPYGTAVTPERLVQIGSAESDLRAAGLRTFRVRYHGDVARLEVSAEEQHRFADPVLPRAHQRSAPGTWLRLRRSGPRAVPLGPPERGWGLPRRSALLSRPGARAEPGDARPRREPGGARCAERLRR
jgi:hypothetical protein